MTENGLEKIRNGRKFRMACYCLIAATAGMLAAVLVPASGVYFGTYLYGLSGILAIYCGGNIGNKFVTNRPEVKVIVDRRKADKESPEDEGPGPAA